MAKTAVLLMAYGTPSSLDEIEPYYIDIRGGRKPTPELLHELTERYKLIGKPPLLEITREQASALQAELGDDYRVYIGMKHWHPYIAETVEQIARDVSQFSRMIGIALAPHYSRFSIDGYIQRVREAMTKSNLTLDVTFVESWNDHPLFLRSIAERMLAARDAMGAKDWQGIDVVFSAHSLPEKILQSGDPYPQELRETCEGVAPLVGLSRDAWRFAYQSAGRTGEKWLGPELLATLDEIAARRGSPSGYPGATARVAPTNRVLIAPIGFVADHLEVLYDIDIQAMEHASKLGMELCRIESPNATPTFIAALAEIVREKIKTQA